MTVYSGIPSQFYPDTGMPITQRPQAGDAFIISSPTSLEDPYESLNLANTTEYLLSQGGSRPDLGMLGVNLGDVAVHALAPDQFGNYETTNASLTASKGGSGISGMLDVGSVGPNGQPARANVSVEDGRTDAVMSLGNNIYVGPQSSLNLVTPPGGGPDSIHMGNTTIVGATLSVALGDNVNDGNALFDLESYFSTPALTSPGVITMAGGITGGTIHVGIDTQLNMSGPNTLPSQANAPWAFRAAITEDPSSQVVLRGSDATDFTYQNGVMSVVNNGVQIADLHITPVDGTNGFSLRQIGPDTVISAIALSPQQLANEAMPTPVLHG